MQLHFHYFTGSARIPIVVLHGLFGSQRNWNAVCRRLSPVWPVYALDLRNHGQSPHAEDMSLAVLAADVLEFLQQQSFASCHLLGHSLGGKVAMQLALNHPGFCQSLLVVDIAPKAYPPRHTDIFAAIDCLQQHKPDSRSAAESLIQPIISDKAVRDFLLSNLRHDVVQGYSLRFNVTAIKQQYSQISAAPSGGEPYSGPCLFLRGEYSSYLSATDRPLIEKWFPNTQWQLIQGAGHWLHAEKPDEFVQQVSNFLQQQVTSQ